MPTASKLSRAPLWYSLDKKVRGEMNLPSVVSAAGARPAVTTTALLSTERMAADDALSMAEYWVGFGLGSQNWTTLGSFQISQ